MGGRILRGKGKRGKGRQRVYCQKGEKVGEMGEGEKSIEGGGRV